MSGATPIFRMAPEARRRAIVERFLNRNVVVHIDSLRDGGDEPYHGAVLAVASTTNGTSSDVLVLRTGRGNRGDLAIGTAIIAGIRLDPAYHGLTAFEHRARALGRIPDGVI